MLRNRLILLALWILSLVGISFYGGPISYGFFAVITLIPIGSLIYLLLVLARFKIYQDFESAGLVSNHKIPFFFTLQNEDHFAFCAVRVKFFSDFSVIDGLSDDIEYELLPGDKIRKETALICRYRGEYCVGIKSVTLRDFLCLFKITYKKPEALRVTVLPDIVRVSELRHIDVDSLSDREVFGERSQPDVTVRDYVPGDDIRSINWKQTARKGTPMVRNYVGEEKNGVALILDPARIFESETEYLPAENRMLEVVIALSLFMEERRIPVSVYTYAGEVKESIVDGPGSFDDLYGSLSSFSFRDDVDRISVFAGISVIQSIYAKRMVFIITSKWDDTVKSLTEELNKNDTEAFVYLVDTEVNEASLAGPSLHTHVIRMPAKGNLSEVL